MEQLTNLLNDKESALEAARAQVSELEKQVDTLRQTLLMLKPTEFEEYLKAKESKTNQPTQDMYSDAKKELSDAYANSVTIPTGWVINEPQNETFTNKKGSVSISILKVLSDGKLRSVEEVLNETNLLLSKPTTHGSIASTLHTLKLANKIENPEFGKYQLSNSGKDETPSVSADSVSIL